MSIVLVVLLMGVVFIVGVVVGALALSDEAAGTTTALHTPENSELAARKARADIAGEVRRAEEQIGRITEPGEFGVSPFRGVASVPAEAGRSRAASRWWLQ